MPIFDSLSSPPFESELKRASSIQKASMLAKPSAHTEIGTSVAPRQRPKGNVSTQNLPLVLPSSPSPHNAMSPSPQVLQANDPNFDGASSATPVSPFAVKAKSNVLQQGDKTPTRNHQTSPPKESNFHPELGSAVKSQRSTSLHADSHIAATAERLFEARFSDSFRDTTKLPPTTATSTSSISSKIDVQSPTSPLQHQLLNAPKFVAGHRRNVSDTSAFNK